MSAADPSGKPATPTKAPLAARIMGAVREEAWSTESLGDKSLQGRVYAAVRIIGITVKGVVLNKIPLNAAALTYYSLMSLGPILALMLILASTVLQKNHNGNALLKEKVAEFFHQIAPQTGVAPVAKDPKAKPSVVVKVASDALKADAIIKAGKEAAKEDAGVPPKPVENTAAASAGANLDHANDHALDKMVDKMITESSSGSASAIGIAILIVLAVLMLTRVENAFNLIWGVTKGRPWKDRFINYVLFMVLGCLLGAASLTMLSAGSVAKSLGDHVPQWLLDLPGGIGTKLLGFFQGAGPTMISVAMLMTLVAMLIRFLPYTRVHWKAAFGGGLFVALALVVNQKLGALYAGKVTQFSNLYGSMSIILVLMFGMYVSWMLLLIGCQLTFAIQYVHRLAAFRTWESLSARTRETLCFGCLVIIARRFRSMERAADSEEMAAALHVPRSITDECLKKLLALKLIVAIDDGDDKPENDRYRPDFPLNALTVGNIRQRLQTHGGASVDPTFGFDAGVVRFTEAFAHFDELDPSRQPFDTLLAETETKAI